MPKVGIIRCEKNEDKCPLTSCIVCLQSGKEGFSGYDEPCELMGVMTCRCPGENAIAAAKILKNKGAEIVHFCTCVEAGKVDGEWTQGLGYCDNFEMLIENTAQAAEIPCVLGTAHLPAGTSARRFSPLEA